MMINHREKLGFHESVAFLVYIICTKIFLGYPSIITIFGGNASWMIVLISGLLTMVFFKIISLLLESFPEKSFREFTEEILGSYLSIGIIIFIIALWIGITAMPLRILTEMMIISILTKAQVSYIAIPYILVAALGAYLGINVIARVCYISYPFILGVIFLILALTMNIWNFDYFFPIFGKGLDQVLTYGLFRTSDFLELSFIYAIPLVFHSKQIKKVGYASVGISTFILFINVIVFSLIFPSVVGEESNLSLFTMAQNIYYGLYLQRIEAIFIIFWVLSGCVWLSAGVYSISHLLTDLLKLPDNRPLIPTIAIIIFALTFITPSFPEVVLNANIKMRNILYIPVFGLPLILLIVSKIRGKGETTR